MLMLAARELVRQVRVLHRAACAHTGISPVREQAVDMGEMVHAVCDAYLRFVPAGTFRVAAHMPSAMGDPLLLHDVLVHLVSNAVKYRQPPHTPVVFTARHSDGYVGYGVRNRGSLPAAPQRLMRVGVRGWHPMTPGVGLGLPAAQMLLRLHGSELQLMSTPDCWVACRFVLPAAPGQHPA